MVAPLYQSHMDKQQAQGQREVLEGWRDDRGEKR